MDYILIVDTPDTGVTEIPGQTVDAGFVFTGYAAAFNNTGGGYLGDISVTWSVINIGSSSSTTPGSGTSSQFSAGNAGGIANWTADDGSGHVDWVVYTINPPAVDYILIVDTGGTGQTEIPDQSVSVVLSITGYAAAFNNTIGYIGDITVDWSVINASGAEGSTNPLSGSSSEFYSGAANGTATWIADDGSGHSDTVVFTVSPPAVDYIIIVDGPGSGIDEIQDATVIAGHTIWGYAAAFNNSLGYMGDISVSWSVNNSGSSALTSPPTGTGSVFNASADPGTATWIADDGQGHSDSVVFSILTPTVDYIAIVDTPGTGANIIPDQTVNVGVAISGYAAAFNNSIGYMYDLQVDWDVSNMGLANATTDPVSSTITSIIYSGHFGGSATWTADDGAGHTDTVDFSINAPWGDFILIVDTPGVGVTEIPDQTVDVAFTVAGHAAAFNNTIGYLGDISVLWTVNNAGGASAETNPGMGTMSTFNANSTGGSGTWTAEDIIGNTDTVVFTINPPEVDEIYIVNTPGTGSMVILDQPLSVDYLITGYATAFNNTIGYMWDISVTWWVVNSGTNASTVPLSGSNTSAFHSGYYGGTATWWVDDGTGHTFSVSFTILAPTVDYILIVDTMDTGATEISAQNMNVGISLTGYVAAFNSSIGY
ncbi:MAG: hypothetical protein KAS67_07535, partial [Thermoplasmata archaeon]|nr:hypothetical protein [Thermoplasmata archaeon]